MVAYKPFLAESDTWMIQVNIILVVGQVPYMATYFPCFRIQYLIFGIINVWNLIVWDTHCCQYLGVIDIYQATYK